MIKYAKVIDEKTRQCIVGAGTNAEFYEKNGMTEQDVEQCEWNGAWYLVGYVPQEPEEHAKQKRIEELKQQLKELDTKSARSIRAILAETATEDDRDFLANLESQAEELRRQIKELQDTLGE